MKNPKDASITDTKRTAQAALQSRFGFAPKLKDITLLESSGDRTYILFRVNGHEYRFNSWADIDGTVHVGLGTLEQLSTDESPLPDTYAEVEYDDFDSAEAIDGARFDDLNYLRYTER